MTDIDIPFVKSSGVHQFIINLLNNLEDDIKTVVDASVPNKIQNRAAQKMSADYFFQARNQVSELIIKTK